MSKGGFFVFWVILIIALVHTSFFLLSSSGEVYVLMSGFATKKINQDNEKEINRNFVNSLIFLVLEWLLVISILIFSFFRNKKFIEKEVKEIKGIEYKGFGFSTDLDKLYFILQQKRRVSISSIAKVFGVDQKIVLKWAQILESAGLAYVDYPRMGVPEIVLVDKERQKEEKVRKNVK